MSIQSVAASEARKHWRETLTNAESEPVSIIRQGNRPDLVLVRADLWEELLEAYEDAEDLEAVESTANDFIPWDQVKHDLSLT